MNWLTVVQALRTEAERIQARAVRSDDIGAQMSAMHDLQAAETLFCLAAALLAGLSDE
jgi:hypothetical protein